VSRNIFPRYHHDTDRCVIFKNQNFLKLYVWGCPASQQKSSQRTPLSGTKIMLYIGDIYRL